MSIKAVSTSSPNNSYLMCRVPPRKPQIGKCGANSSVTNIHIFPVLYSDKVSRTLPHVLFMGDFRLLEFDQGLGTSWTKCCLGRIKLSSSLQVSKEKEAKTFQLRGAFRRLGLTSAPTDEPPKPLPDDLSFHHVTKFDWFSLQADYVL